MLYNTYFKHYTGALNPFKHLEKAIKCIIQHFSNNVKRRVAKNGNVKRVLHH